MVMNSGNKHCPCKRISFCTYSQGIYHVRCNGACHVAAVDQSGPVVQTSLPEVVQRIRVNELLDLTKQLGGCGRGGGAIAQTHDENYFLRGESSDIPPG